MGHAGAWAAPAEADAGEKVEVLEKAGVVIVDHPEKFGEGMKKLLHERQHVNYSSTDKKVSRDTEQVSDSQMVKALAESRHRLAGQLPSVEGYIPRDHVQVLFHKKFRKVFKTGHCTSKHHKPLICSMKETFKPRRNSLRVLNHSPLLSPSIARFADHVLLLRHP